MKGIISMQFPVSLSVKNMLLALVAVLFVAVGCQSGPKEPAGPFGIGGYVMKPDRYQYPESDNVTVSNLVATAGGLDHAIDLNKGRVLAVFMNDLTSAKVSVKKDKWGIPLSQLNVHIRDYQALDIQYGGWL